MDAELEFAIQPNTTGKQLFDQVSFHPQVMQPVCLCVCVCVRQIVCICVIYRCVLCWWGEHAKARGDKSSLPETFLY
jgi:hypothetical protein